MAHICSPRSSVILVQPVGVDVSLAPAHTKTRSFEPGLRDLCRAERKAAEGAEKVRKCVRVCVFLVLMRGGVWLVASDLQHAQTEDARHRVTVADQVASIPAVLAQPPLPLFFADGPVVHRQVFHPSSPAL